MELGIVGLGKMGFNMAKRLLRDGHRVIAYDRRSEVVERIENEGAIGATTLEKMIEMLEGSPRVVWLMVPAGEDVTQTIESIAPILPNGSIIVDGGNSHYKDSVARAKSLQQQGLHFLHVGTSGGVWGLEMGYCMMVGGEEEVFHQLEPLLRSLSPADGYAHVGASGSGHYVKMVHNGIEYGMLQAYGEGFELMEASPYDLNLGQLAKLWGHGSVVRSWLLELAEDALTRDPGLDAIQGYVEDSGEGRWMAIEAIERSVPALVITGSLFARFRSRQKESFSAKMVAALRQEFGGHVVKST